MRNPFSLAGKVILVTGASSGIGREIAVQCAQLGAKLFLLGRSEEKLKVLLTELGNDPVHEIVLADLREESSFSALIGTLPTLDGVVFNAGALKLSPLKFIKNSDVNEIFQVNIISTMMLIQQLHKNKKLCDGSSLCFISSVASLNVTLGNSVYSASKGALNSFTKSVALELAPKGIRANAILPGFIQTNLMKGQGIADDQLEAHKLNYPIGRYGKAEDVAYLAVYLLSDASSFMTGSLLTIDGGYSIK